MEEDILIEFFSMVGVRLIEGVIDLKAFRSIGIMGTRGSGVSAGVGGRGEIIWGSA